MEMVLYGKYTEVSKCTQKYIHPTSEFVRRINSIRLLCNWMMTVDTRNYELLKDSYEVFSVDKLKAVKLLDQNVYRNCL
ncbi:unnamed protein product [Heterobilharzia americana]|nr:unnamed protein product [Heterobilharzia americana]